jgi:eukaryotic-like serine/threonine-protein kinase
MALGPGSRLDAYELVRPLGSGGMGEVWLATELRLGRKVALKLLPPELTSDPVRVQRFEQEARAASALNHPNVCTIHALGETADGQHYIAMEYVEGETLRHRLSASRLTIRECLDIAIQVAAALSAAHDAGIIHRDIKPENVMLRPDGLVKVLDFGLAKLLETPRAEAETAAMLTTEGTILGTAAYMSPEQVEGKSLDARSDIFSFGTMLYEMLTGQRPFSRDTAGATIAAILRDEPRRVDQIAEGLPLETVRIVRRCLRKDPEHRFQTMADLRVALEELKQESESDSLELAGSIRTIAGRRWWLVALAIAGIGTIAGIASWLAKAPSQAHESLPEVSMVAKPLVTYTGDLGDPSFSPEGDRVAFTWSGENQDNADIYVRLIGPGEPQRLTTNPARDFGPAWSPDGRYIAFLRDDTNSFASQLARRFAVCMVPALGGTERCLTKIAAQWSSFSCCHMTWSHDSKLLVASDGEPYGLHLISVDTGDKRRLTSPPANGADGSPAFSPDGHWLAFVRMRDLGIGDVYRISLTHDYRPAGEPERLTHEQLEIVSPVWTSDGRQILYSAGSWFTSGRAVRRITLSGVQSGFSSPAVQQPFGEDAWELAISPARRRLVYHRGYRDSDIYRIELRGKNGRVGAPQRFIASTRADLIPEYSPDGRTIAFSSSRSGSEEIWLCDADGSNQRQLTNVGSPLVSNARWSPDGKTLLFDSRREGSSDLYLINAEGGSPRRLTSDPGYEGEARWSSDGKWIYYRGDRDGRDQVYKVPVGGGSAVQVTTKGGLYAFESPDGRWLYYSKYVGSVGTIWRMPVTGGEEHQVAPGPIGGQHFNFVVVENGVFFTKDAPTGGTLEFVDVARGKSRTVLQVDKRWGLGLTVSPDRRWLLVTLWRDGPAGLNDLMLVENFR